MTSASTKAYAVNTLADLAGQLPVAKVRGVPISRVILGGNLLSGWAHSRDLICVSQLVKAYHHKDKYCDDPDETMAYMATLEQPWIAFKTMAAGAIHPSEAFRFAFEGGADFVCAGMYDFQMVDDVNIALDVLTADLKRDRPWRA